MVFEALHDMARPVEALSAIRALLTTGGCLIVGDEKVAAMMVGERAEHTMHWCGRCVAVGPQRFPI